MRILHVVRQYAPGVGGMEACVAALAQCQKAAGHDVRVLTLDRIFDGDGAVLPHDETIDGIRVTRVPFRGSRRYPIAPAALRRLGDAEIVNVHGVDFFADALAIARPVHRRRLILFTHGGFFHTGFAQRLKRLFFQTVTRASLMQYSAILASSVQDGETFSTLWPEKTFVIENGVDTRKFAGLGGGDPRTMIYFGRIAPNKGLDRLLPWFAALTQAEPGWRLIVAGKPMGVPLADIHRQAGALGIGDQVETHDTPDDDELRALIARSSVYACASRYEGFGIAPIEAVSAGLYPVLSDIPAFQRTRARIGWGTIVDFDAPPDPAAFLRDLADYRATAPGADAIAQRLAPFSWNGVAEAVEGVYQRVVGHEIRRIGCVDVTVFDEASALAEILAAVDQRRPLVIAFLNAHSANIAHRDPAFVKALSHALVLNDGIGVDIASRLVYGEKFPANLNGTDLVPRLMAGLTRPTRLFLIGSKPGVAAEAGARFARDFPNVRIVGARDGFFSPADEPEIVEQITRSGADMVFCGMGNPRQEMWASRTAPLIGVPIVCLGALFDFATDRVSRAPEWVRQARFEWMYRLMQEPRRLARRYLIGNGVFLSRVAWQWASSARVGSDVVGPR
jgi:alpha-1,3-mannosyltransferase